MPFRLHMSQDIFHARIDQLVEGLEGVIAIADDIIVFGMTEAEHDAALRHLLQRCLESGLKLNPDKMRIRGHAVKFYGVICLADGIKPGPRKVTALRNMSAPTCSQEVLSFLVSRRT